MATPISDILLMIILWIYIGMYLIINRSGVCVDPPTRTLDSSSSMSMAFSCL